MLEAEDDTDLAELSRLRLTMTVNAPGYNYTRRYKLFKRTKGNLGWDGKVRILQKLDSKSLCFPTGLLESIIEETKFKVKINDLRGIGVSSLDWNISKNTRDYQEEVIKACLSKTLGKLWWPRGIIECATGCVDADTEFLSPFGWIKISDYNGELVGQYNNGECEFVIPNEYYKLPCSKFYEIKTKYGINMCLSPEHIFLYKLTKKSKEFSKLSFQEVKNIHENNAYGFRGLVETVNVKYRKDKGHTEYNVHITHRNLISFSKGSEDKPKIEEITCNDGFKYCFSVPSEMLILRRGNCIFVTGNSGKTKIAAELIKIFKVPTLFVVHREHLLHQTDKEFLNAGIKSRGIFGSGFYQTEAEVIISTIQTLHSKLKQSPQPWLENIKQVFIDECHLAAATLDKGNTFISTLNNLENAHIRWGLTATPFMRDVYSNRLLEGVTGKSIHVIKAQELIESGYLVRPLIKMIKMKCDSICPKSWPECYDVAIVLNEKRNQRIVDEAKISKKPCMILVDRIAHGQMIQKKFNSIIPFIHGEVDKSIRRDVIAGVIGGNIATIIASTVFDEGISIDNLRTIILAGGKKSHIKCVQRIGRGMRIFPEKDGLDIIDFFDEYPNKIKSHSSQRLKIYKSEGYEVEIIA